uniref:Uncharacterized protein n=1 Tax=Acrobeloides nanus TaxID=290746 RepID=A0A914BZY1_9BILA
MCLVMVITLVTMFMNQASAVEIIGGFVVLLFYICVKAWAWLMVKRTHSYYSEILLNEMVKEAQAEEAGRAEQYQMNRY